MRKMLSAVFAALLLVSCNSDVGEARVPKAARPALWAVSDADTTIYLFGTVHLLPAGLKWVTPKVARAIEASDALVIETVLDKDQTKLGATMLALGMSPGLPPVLKRVPADKRDKLAAVIAKSKLPVAALDGMETWAAGLTLATVALQGLGVSQEQGGEAQLTTRFVNAGKAVTGLETPEQQLRYFDGLPERAQRAFLVSIADDGDNAKAELDRMIAAWSAGDLAAIAASFDDELKLSPELSEVLLKQRNLRWSAWVDQRLDQPGTVFLAVGAGHLAGADSVNVLLERRGVRVRRLQ